MRFLDLLRLSLENLGRRTGRAFLTAIGVVIGTAAVVVLVSLGMGLQRSMTMQFGSISELTQIQVHPNYGDYVEGIAYEVASPIGPPGSPPPNQRLITDQSLEDFVQLPGVTGVYPRDWLQSGQIKFGRYEGWGEVLGVPPDTLKELGLVAEQGGLELGKGTVVIGSAIQQNFYDPRLQPGQPPPPVPEMFDQNLTFVLYKWTKDGVEVRKSVQARVVGVLAETRLESDYQIYMTLEEVEGYNQWVLGRRILRSNEGYPMTIVNVGEIGEVLDVADRIAELGYQVYTPQTYVQGIQGFFLILQIIFGGIGAISLLVAAIGIANTMTMAILERTRDIGLMKAVGATNRDVMGIFLAEAAGIGLFGGIGGIVLGWTASQIVNVLGLVYMAGQVNQNGWMNSAIASYTPTWLLIFGVLFATLIGTLSGLYPALRAATLIPVEALKYE